MGGASLQFVRRNVDVPAPDIDSTLGKALARGLARVAKLTNTEYPTRPPWHKILRQTELDTKRYYHRKEPELAELYDLLSAFADNGYLLASGDKDTKAAVFVEPGFVATWLYKTFFEEPDHIR